MESPSAPAPRAVASKLPNLVCFALVCVASLSLSALAHSLTAEISGFEFATASRNLTEPWQVGCLVGWKLIQLAWAWRSDYEIRELAGLTLLANAPYHYLLHAFWGIEKLPVAIHMAIDIGTVALPFAPFRTRRAQSSTVAKSPNQEVARDWQVDIVYTVFASTVYGLALFLGYQANLSVFMVTHFDQIQTFEKAHAASVMNLTPLFLGNGLASMYFLFLPSMEAASVPKMKVPQIGKFKPESATLRETIAYNFGFPESGWTPRASVLGRRSLVLLVSVFLNTIVRVFATVQGADIIGAMGYAGMWAFSNAAVAFTFGVMGQE